MEQTPVFTDILINKQGANLYVKMQVIPSVKEKNLPDFAQHYIEPGSTIVWLPNICNPT